MNAHHSAKKRQSVNFTKNFFEKSAWDAQSMVVGIDEVGRGCLAGPLVTAAVMLPLFKAPSFLKDSKLMTEQDRLEAHIWIVQNCALQIGIVHHRIIDRINIWQATLMGMKKALVNLLAQPIARPSAILIDAMPLGLADTPYADIPIYHFIKGESKSSSIAAASIVAKVTRDGLMEKYSHCFPGYELGQHKGYSTQVHQNRVREFGPSIIHRTTFIASVLGTSHEQRQQTLC